jgi:formylglycine-generating enzyme required for sulfatase activity
VAARRFGGVRNWADRARPHPRPLVQGFQQDVWEWTGSAFMPYPGYRPLPGAIGEYNGKFMINQMVLRGRSCATAPGHDRLSYRNFFPASARWQFSGFRLAEDI